MVFPLVDMLMIKSKRKEQESGQIYTGPNPKSRSISCSFTKQVSFLCSDFIFFLGLGAGGCGGINFYVCQMVFKQFS